MNLEIHLKVFLFFSIEIESITKSNNILMYSISTNKQIHALVIKLN